MPVKYLEDGSIDRSNEARMFGTNHWFDLCDEINRLNARIKHDREENSKLFFATGQHAGEQAKRIRALMLSNAALITELAEYCLAFQAAAPVAFEEFSKTKAHET